MKHRPGAQAAPFLGAAGRLGGGANVARLVVPALLLVVASVILLSGPTPPLPHLETFESYPARTWSEGSTHGDWHVDYDGHGRVWVGSADAGDKVLNLRPTTDPPSTGTSAALVTSRSTTSGDLVLTLRMRTLLQNAGQRRLAERANPWEAGWVFWNHRTEPGTGDEGTGKVISEVEKGYYLVLKTDGWELGKLDQELFLGTGGQRYLATGTSPTFPVGPAWRQVTIRQVRVDDARVRITVRVDGEHLVQFTDGPGSGGQPRWSVHPQQEVYTGGRVGLYTEDARVQFDDITRTTT
jgi:hypothetical protein